VKGGRNLRAMYERADADDRREGLLAYARYNQVMREFAEHYGIDLERTTAAFVALSPNNDYFGNLRSLASVLQGARECRPPERVTVSTYGHCKRRALAYAKGEASFVGTVRGLKIRSFYFNILDPTDPQPVTIDGHMKAAYLARKMTMRQAIVKSRAEYERIAAAAKRIANTEGLVPNQLQAIIWFARKRTERIKYDGQYDMFRPADDLWRTIVRVHEAPPY